MSEILALGKRPEDHHHSRAQMTGPSDIKRSAPCSPKVSFNSQNPSSGAYTNKEIHSNESPLVPLLNQAEAMILPLRSAPAAATMDSVFNAEKIATPETPALLPDKIRSFPLLALIHIFKWEVEKFNDPLVLTYFYPPP